MNGNSLTKKEIVTLLCVAAILIGGGLVIGWHFGYEGFNPLPKSDGLSLADFYHAYHVVQADYYVATDTEPLIGSAIRAFVAGLGDHYSFYLGADEYKKLKAQDDGQLFDIGILFVTRNKHALILEVYPDTPAEAFGLMSGDIITHIDGVDTATLPGTLPITMALLGKDGESIAIRVLKRDGATKNLAIVRKRYTAPTVVLKTLGDQASYLKIYSFDTRLQTDFVPVAQAIKNSGINKLIIDLRNNPGGDVDTAIALLNKFINTGTLFSEQIGRNSNPVFHQAAGNAEFADTHIVLIVNDLTASAAEIFTAALQENHRAVVVGTTTEGKATEQRYITLHDGSAVRLTIGKWFTPNGEWINGKGITPDVGVSDVVGATDVPMKAAMEQLAK